MKKMIRLGIFITLLALNICGCGETTTNESEQSNTTSMVTEESNSETRETTEETVHEHAYMKDEIIQPTCTSEGYTVYKCTCGDTYDSDQTEKLEHAYKETVIAPTTEAEGYTLYTCTICNHSMKDNFTEKIVLDDKQKNSIAMLNYLAALSQEINDSKNSRIFLEEAYASLINNTNPENVNELTESHLCSLLDTIEEYRLITVKRERLEYLYNQSKAVAIREAIPNPMAVLSAATSLDIKRLVASVAYMAIDSVSSYNAYNDELDNAYLQEGWGLDDEADQALHESRKYAFQFMIQIVRDEKLPGDLALSESAVENFVTWTTGDKNVYQRLQFLESEEITYKGFGNYWLALADCYYELAEYKKCLSAISTYEECQANIFRKDYYLAQIMPKAISAASEVYTEEDYVLQAERFLEILVDNTDLKNSENNTDSGDWALRYFAAQIYMDLYTKTGNGEYLNKAYDLVINNINFLVEKQKKLNQSYLAEVKEVEVAKTATKEEKKQVKDYNNALHETRKTELPPVYEPLILNCELLVALAEKIEISEDEKKKVESILELTDSTVFLVAPLASRYDFKDNTLTADATFEKTELILPVSCVSENSVIKVTVQDSDSTVVYDDWAIKRVDRTKEGFSTYLATYVSQEIKDHKWSAGTKITVEIYDGADSAYSPIELYFEASGSKKMIVFDSIKFTQVN